MLCALLHGILKIKANELPSRILRLVLWICHVCRFSFRASCRTVLGESNTCCLTMVA